MNRMSIAAVILFIAGCAAVFFFLMGSKKQIHHSFDSGVLYQGAKEVDPTNRNLQLIMVLSSEQVAVVNEFFRSGSTSAMSHVLSEHYLELERGTEGKVLYGVVIKSDGNLIGLDVTGGDASTAIVTGMHEIVRNNDADLCRRLLVELQLLPRYEPGT